MLFRDVIRWSVWVAGCESPSKVQDGDFVRLKITKPQGELMDAVRAAGRMNDCPDVLMTDLVPFCMN